MSILGLLLVVILVVILLGGVGGPYVSPNWQYGYGLGHGGVGIIGVILIVVIIMLLMGRIP